MSNQINNKKKFSRGSFVKFAFATGFFAFLSKLGFSSSVKKQATNTGTKVKMLTPDGKLVEVDRRVVEAASKRTKASNSEIHNFVSVKKNKKG